jgi:hypothetical protein
MWLMSDAMNGREREALAKLIRQRERLAKTAATERSARLRADFEQQLDRKYSFDEDPVWRAATLAAEQVMAEAQAKVAARSAELGIPRKFAPKLSLGWCDRGRNASKEERAELRRVANSRIEQLEKSARLAIEHASVAAQEQLLVGALTSTAAQAFLEQLPNIESLMPGVDLPAMEQLLTAKRPLGHSRHTAIAGGDPA